MTNKKINKVEIILYFVTTILFYITATPDFLLIRGVFPGLFIIAIYNLVIFVVAKYIFSGWKILINNVRK